MLLAVGFVLLLAGEIFVLVLLYLTAMFSSMRAASFSSCSAYARFSAARFPASPAWSLVQPET